MVPHAARLRVWLALALALLAALAGCGRSPQLAPLARDAVVLAFGDSLTYGTGAGEAQSYPAQLEQLIARRVVRSGVPGEVTAAALARLPGALEAHAPKLLILCIGGNDFLRNLSKSAAAQNVRAMVALAKARGIDVLLIGTPEKGITVTPPAFYAEIAEAYDIPYEGKVIGQVLRDNALKSDPIHPNAQGYRLIAVRVAELLREAGAI
ncbi:MAG: GDSL-type esterase/lipase family protein [Betaproteobacteria bacterium]|jgi:acyl-CoA thioesterase-1|nr:GDSL-type esterase/lipase family protein [Betaproteobacteria bacterium]